MTAHNNGLTAKDPYPWLERSGLAALLAGSMLVLITFFTFYSHVDIPAHASIAVNQQIRIPLLSAALAALVGVDVVFSVGVVKLASNARCAAQCDRIEARIRATEERNHSAVDEVGRRPKNESEQLKIENARLAALESKLDPLMLSADPSSPIPPQSTATERNPGPAAGGSGLLQVKPAHKDRDPPANRQHHGSTFTAAAEPNLDLVAITPPPWQAASVISAIV